MTRMPPISPHKQVATPYMKELSKAYLAYKETCKKGPDEYRSYAGNDIVGVAKTISPEMSSKKEQLATAVALCAVCNDSKMHGSIASDAGLFVRMLAEGPHGNDVIKTVRAHLVKGSDLHGVVKEIEQGGSEDKENIDPDPPLSPDLFGPLPTITRPPTITRRITKAPQPPR